MPEVARGDAGAMADWKGRFRILERAALRAWPSAETVEYDGWVLRASGGYTKRANSVNPHFGSTLPIGDKLAFCEGFYRERELPVIFRLTPFSCPSDLDRILASAGFTTLDPTLVLTRDLANWATRRRPPARTAIRSASPAEWLDAFEQLRGLDEAERLPHRRIVEMAEGERLFALAEDGGRPVACGLAVFVDGVLGLFDVFTAESHRRRGYAAAIVGSLLDRALALDATSAFLQVHSLNGPAARLYEQLGFAVAYPYWYRIAPGQNARSSLEPSPAPGVGPLTPSADTL